MQLFEEFLHLKIYSGQHFWERGYFCVTAGELNRNDKGILRASFEQKSHDNAVANDSHWLQPKYKWTFSPPK
ncbi:hypothetical protein N474_02680 [Pseudoalteromonas luteoviolacea CPMOR-2]|uniref:Transposase IS200-like domain-containing protein n=1 Tax=Pseudoalteromonas luteoviolacea DSM 6061 TaxID=1365250 RepID=A0A161ZSL9_9GAMM|nr:hypothetical protein N475_23855 [Pseudoalteromonas luteoviolacea DSM 6061]KZN53420.1 hypothetical protein N474_02680 [Pseudoalteromonas luteoviolacea CPMOR-2]MBE0386228.1 hypothetical protein [Pseudoalteromonas luteoviolacea DSM 6061]